jgi:ribosomal protein S18 acetylase RimI-like enzyme
MFVRPELRGQGIGGALVASVVAAAEERRYARLVVAPSERAVSLYRRAGFTAADGSSGELLLVRSA